MQKVSLSSIKRESVRAIFNSIASKSSISRADIADETGLSLMTVGKVIDALSEKNIVCQVKENKAAAGRKANLVSLNKEQFIVIFDLSSKDYNISILNANLDVVETLSYSVPASIDKDDSLMLYLRNAKNIINRKHNLANCIGIGTTLPGAYDPQKDMVINSRNIELSTLRIKEKLSQIYDISIIKLEEDIYAAASAYASEYSSSLINTGDMPIVYINVGEKIRGTIVFNDVNNNGHYTRSGNFGALILDNKQNLETVVNTYQDKQKIIEIISEILYNISVLIEPSAVIIEYDKSNTSTITSLDESDIEAIQKRLIYLDTSFSHKSFILKIDSSVLKTENGTSKHHEKNRIKNSHKWLAAKVRDEWLDTQIQ